MLTMVKFLSRSASTVYSPGPSYRFWEVSLDPMVGSWGTLPVTPCRVLGSTPVTLWWGLGEHSLEPKGRRQDTLVSVSVCLCVCLCVYVCGQCPQIS